MNNIYDGYTYQDQKDVRGTMYRFKDLYVYDNIGVVRASSNSEAIDILTYAKSSLFVKEFRIPELQHICNNFIIIRFDIEHFSKFFEYFDESIITMRTDSTEGILFITHNDNKDRFLPRLYKYNKYELTYIVPGGITVNHNSNYIVKDSYLFYKYRLLGKLEENKDFHIIHKVLIRPSGSYFIYDKESNELWFRDLRAGTKILISNNIHIF